MSFDRVVERFITRAKEEADRRIRAITLELFSGIILRTPVGNPDYWKSPAPPGYVGGRLRGNWQTSKGAPKQGQLDNIDATGSTTIAGVAVNMGGLGDVTYMANNLPYARPVEFGHSKQQAPGGMVRLEFARIGGILRNAAA